MIENDLDARIYNWSKMTVALTSVSPKEEIEEVSTFLYDVATVIQKDFDTDTYLIGETKMVPELQEHFQRHAEAFSTDNIGSHIRDYIAQELNAKRPCMLYMEDIKKTTGHAVVIDGYKQDGNKFLVHLNMGWEGKADGWYDFDEPIDILNNANYRLVLSIRPKYVSSPSGASGISIESNSAGILASFISSMGRGVVSFNAYCPIWDTCHVTPSSAFEWDLNL